MFFKDFKLNEQQTNLTTFVDGQVVEYAKLFVPGLECCWSIIYEDEKKINSLLSVIPMRNIFRSLKKR